MSLGEIKEIAGIAASLATVAGFAAAFYWFLFTRSFKRRIQFDCDLKIFDVGQDGDYVAELVISVENKGQREHRLYNLWCEVRQPRILRADGKVASYLPMTNLVPEALCYFFIPSGIRQTFPKTFRIPRSEKVVRVIAMFTYEPKRLNLKSLQHLTLEALDSLGYTTHSVAKLFEVKPTESE
jgi:hypothetical protein